nr:polymer-forming cytoskeletal protein [Dissulfurirhabdus thermomarina]
MIGANTLFEGNCFSERSICVEGTIRGRVESKGSVILGTNGKVEGDILATSVVVGGQVVGNIVATGHLEVTSTGRVKGDIMSPTFVINEGGIVDGMCRMIGVGQETPPQLEQVSAVLEEEPGSAG